MNYRVRVRAMYSMLHEFSHVMQELQYCTVFTDLLLLKFTSQDMLLSTDVLLINALKRYERNGITQLYGKYIIQPCQILRCKIPKKCLVNFYDDLFLFLTSAIEGFGTSICVCMFFFHKSIKVWSWSISHFHLLNRKI